ncbi:hypothetical protein ABB37_09645 [Leptomonas pyrrhocoris]|uniref:Uncharacterized protein n=1 Tax=Leptomonas pyrrhocoris TaxID=157538 RepID=A0A0M9FQ19_LEPPY|nr:hypothetical protein ABB37_09645 [Leptomonas pyrrhocoris]XP_015652179.1 hypothetical protein ABB37_09645 [Leptomonas pyrrhocoris]XP_015652180.1 hypothetical protein ABB37_09645 [Leptomonas pyrrhocoris]KPA73739.1 hypothetical protein ABB37_09645 [Leptomonas pyrrhocoris]KPA73740.1 hypothetical protein ABB37_09645 [Leptomonas pyrrhocoris]KPA73741.1 hypothetical protein ABB37_09645 [Leptomonas pyrrhocoris]|eukprot:XP_015652178.1 hypothetical protein ABB37_09645 [Leptomonas pyrrhocoris]
MSTALHTSSEGHRSAAAAAASLPRPQLRNTKPEVHRDDGTATTTITETTPQRRSTAQPLSTSTDTDGLRCEVLSMRSVPHALYTLPSVSHVVAAYVRQLMDDFASSLLMCRPARRYVFQDRGSKNANGESESTAMKSGVAARATVLEDEETYLTLGLCALEARQRRRWRHAQHTRRQHRVAEDEAKDDDNSFDWLWDSAVSGDGDRNGGDTVRLHPNLAAVESQLIELFATTAQARRGGNCSSHHHETSRLNSAIGADGAPTFLSASAASSPQPPLPPQPHPDEEVDPSLLTPPLLSSLLRFKPLLRDMQFLSRHLLLPRHTWSHHQREWVSVYEDVSVTLRDRLARYQATTTTAVSASDRDVGDADEDASSKAAERVEGDSAKRVGGGTRVMPASEVEQLWYTLWELLGAAWRQRDRLWGAYRYLQGPRQLPPLSLSSQAARAPPPGVHSSPLLRDQHARHLVHAAQTMNRNHPRRPSRAPPSLVSAHDEDSCAFGPFTSSDVGVSSDRLYVLRQPLAAALRSLRVCVPASGRDALATSTTAFAGFTYVTARAGSSATAAPQSAPQSSPPPPCVVVPLFDATEEDARLRAAVPYLSPEVYLSQQLRHQQQQQQKRLPFQQEVGEDSRGEEGRAGTHRCTASPTMCGTPPSWCWKLRSAGSQSLPPRTAI